MRAKMINQILRILLLVPLFRILLINQNFMASQERIIMTPKPTSNSLRRHQEQQQALFRMRVYNNDAPRTVEYAIATHPVALRDDKKQRINLPNNEQTETEVLLLNKKKKKKKKKQIKINNSFDWTDVDLTQNGNCGWHKCFWRSVSNPTSIGYLIADGGARQYERMKLAADFALDLETKFGSKHFHLDLVVVENVNDDFINRLNDLVDQPARQVRGFTNNDAIYRNMDRRLVVETVQIAPNPALFFGSAKANKQMTVNQVPEFKSQIPDKDAFREQLQSEYKRLTKVLQHHPTLVLDFQAFIDPAGQLYHIDLDGHFAMAKREENNKTEREVAECLSFLEDTMNGLTTI